MIWTLSAASGRMFSVGGVLAGWSPTYSGVADLTLVDACQVAGSVDTIVCPRDLRGIDYDSSSQVSRSADTQFGWVSRSIQLDFKLPRSHLRHGRLLQSGLYFFTPYIHRRAHQERIEHTFDTALD